MDNLDIKRSEQEVYNETIKQGLWGNILNIIISPSKAFSSLAEKQRILLPLVIILLSFVLLQIPKASIGEDYLRETMEKTVKSEKYLKTQALSSEDAEKLIDMQMKYAKISLYGSLIAIPFSILVTASIFFGLFKLLGGAAGYKQTLAVFVFTYFIRVAGEIIRTINVIISKKYDMMNSFGMLMEDDKTSVLFNLINSLDIFAIWAFAVTAFGLSIIHKVSQKKAYITIFTVWAVYLVVTAFITKYSASMYL